MKASATLLTLLLLVAALPVASIGADALRKQARFRDGSPITVDDVIWTFETLKTKGHPFYRSYYTQVTKAEAAGPRRVRFTFKAGMNRELPLIVGQMPVLPKARWTG